MAVKNFVRELLPSGEEAEFESIDVSDANAMLNTELPADQLYQLVEKGVIIDPDGARTP